ncbi:MAG: hypothetical protein ACYSU7_07565 [Planctomycetota bacterium]
MRSLRAAPQRRAVLVVGVCRGAVCAALSGSALARRPRVLFEYQSK